MQIFVKTLASSLVLEVQPSSTVGDVMAMVEDREFLPAAMQRLVTGSCQLVATDTLEDAGVEEADTLTVLMHVNGGMRAKWRKKRMRRLRRKRRKMRQRAR